MKKLESHVHLYQAHMLTVKRDFKGIYQTKRDAAARDAKHRHDFETNRPQVGDRVYFRSQSFINGPTFTGYGIVTSLIVRDYKRCEALYRVKADNGITYECYLNHIDENKQGEFIEHDKR